MTATPHDAGQHADILRGIRILTEVADRPRTADAIAERLGADRGTLASEVERLTAVGLLRRRGDGVDLGETTTRLLEGLVGRSDLVAIAAPLVAEARGRLGVAVRFSVNPRVGAPMDEVDSSTLRVLVMDGFGEVVGAIEAQTSDLAPDGRNPLDREMRALASAITARLPRPKSRPGR